MGFWVESFTTSLSIEASTDRKMNSAMSIENRRFMMQIINMAKIVKKYNLPMSFLKKLVRKVNNYVEIQLQEKNNQF